MTGFEFQTFTFDEASVAAADSREARMANWPVVYLLDDGREMYVGESGYVTGRLRQHLNSPLKRHLREVRLVLDERFNKSVCLDLESFLIRLLSGDGQYAIINRNEGITNREYYQRGQYQKTFNQIFEKLRSLGYFTRSIPEIENSDLFKLSPFKALNLEHATAVNEVMEGLQSDLLNEGTSLSIVKGGPGTGKTVVGIYLIKLLRDLAAFDPSDEVNGDSVFSDFFLQGSRETFADLRLALVVPQQSLRASINRVFTRIPALRSVPVLSAFDLAESDGLFDVVVVDEAHRLTQRAAQAHGTLTKKYRDIVTKLFGRDDPEVTQLDWLRAKSRHVVLLLDTGQSVRPTDIDTEDLVRLTNDVSRDGRLYRLETQMRVSGGSNYLDFVTHLLHGTGDARPAGSHFAYDLRLFDDLQSMRDEIRRRDAESGLSRLVAGYAWEWVSRKDRSLADINIDGVSLNWNQTATDLINSRTALDEVGSIHTVQGYDLNYAGVIIGNDLQYDPESHSLRISREDYFDRKGKANNRLAGKITTDDDLRRYILNIYNVLLTRGMRGTYIYIVDPHLRQHVRLALQRFMSGSPY